MSTTTLPLSIGVTELTLADGSVTELVMSSVIDNKPYYDLAFAAAKVYTDAQDGIYLGTSKEYTDVQDAAYLVTTQNEFTAADAVVLSSANTYTDTSSSNAITTAETFATAGDTAAKAFAIQRANHTGTQSVSTITGLADVATSGLKADVGLSNVDNLAPIDMPVSTAQATADTATLNSAKSYSDSGDTTTLTSAKAYADSLVAGLFDFRGDYNASGNTYPTSSNNGSGSAGAVLKADVWRISVQGTLQGKTARVGDLLTALVDSPAQTDANWTLTSNELAYTPENTANKATDLSSNDSTHYPTTAAVQTAINTREPSIIASVVTSFWSGTKTFRDLATDVRVVVLTGLSTATGTAITAADTILSALGKLQNQASTNATAIADFEASRWAFQDFDNNNSAGGVATFPISSGTTTFGINTSGTFGAIRCSSSTTANSGFGYGVNQPVLFKQDATTRSIFVLESAQSTRLIRAGFITAISAYAASETNGIFIEINDQTATAVCVNATTTTTQGSVVLPLNTVLVCDVTLLTNTSARLTVFDKGTLTKYIDQTITTNIPTSSIYSGIKATSSGTAVVALMVLDYIGRGAKKPYFIVTPP